LEKDLVVKVGCCGFPRSRKQYFKEFSVVELQNTFYNLPTISWAEKIRREAPDNFEFSMKAWQVITHPKRSPTWKKLRDKPPGDPNNYGFLKPTKENLSALEKTVEVASILKSKIIVLQTPPSMPFSEEMIRQVDLFFENAESIVGDIMLGWEPRGRWAEQHDVLRAILEKHRVIHIVDPFRREPVWYNDIIYFRLHGIGPRETNYKYKYTDKDLQYLLDRIRQYNAEIFYVMFNNIYMYDDALRFKRMLEDNKIRTI